MLTMGHETNDYILVMFHILERLYDPPRFNAKGLDPKATY